MSGLGVEVARARAASLSQWRCSGAECRPIRAQEAAILTNKRAAGEDAIGRHEEEAEAGQSGHSDTFLKIISVAVPGC